MAIAALVLGILWLCGLGSIVAIILGIVAIKKINRSQGELGGRGLAIGGIATGAAGLLLVLPIIAAIAIPVFLNQREMAWDAAARSDLRNAAVIQESHYVEASTYASDIEDLEAEGYNGSADVELTIVTGGQSSYCMEAKHRSSTQYWYLDSSTFQPSEGRC